MKPACVADYREAARRRLPRVLFDYIDGGSYAEETLAANVADIQALKLRQRVLKDVSQLSTGTELFGERLSMPVVLSPVGPMPMGRVIVKVVPSPGRLSTRRSPP